jgi:hypothetical protein
MENHGRNMKIVNMIGDKGFIQGFHGFYLMGCFYERTKNMETHENSLRYWNTIGYCGINTYMGYIIYI